MSCAGKSMLVQLADKVSRWWSQLLAAAAIATASQSRPFLLQ